MMDNLFEQPENDYRLDRKVLRLRQKIKDRTAELQITPDHNEEGHFYKFGDQRYASVTGWLKLLKDPSITIWQKNRMMDYIYNNFESFTQDNILHHIEQAKNAPQLEFEGAGSLGTAVHDWRELVFGKVIDGIEWDEAWESRLENNQYENDRRFLSACRAIKTFVAETNYKPVACELYVADHELQTGGQVDDIGFVNGTLALVDLKTSNQGDKESYYAQTALYMYMFRRLYRVRPAKLHILHVSKTDGTYNLIDIPEIQENIKWAKKVIEVGQGQQRIKDSKKKKIDYI